ncbi:MAG: hypothetical protein EZS28_028033 [Streblomastix strix]|uniref:Decapping nuclease n=1 Tax=Streblomastix strix TaxID=222440 RepID=A0A5J4V221_9EUKA|nr:MAG: hypothetical protein EZS28_028033 [Streblomastix strix]
MHNPKKKVLLNVQVGSKCMNKKPQLKKIKSKVKEKDSRSEKEIEEEILKKKQQRHIVDENEIHQGNNEYEQAIDQGKYVIYLSNAESQQRKYSIKENRERFSEQQNVIKKNNDSQQVQINKELKQTKLDYYGPRFESVCTGQSTTNVDKYFWPLKQFSYFGVVTLSGINSNIKIGMQIQADSFFDDQSNQTINSPHQTYQSSSQQEFNHNSVSPSIIPIALPSNSSPSKVFIDYIPYSIRKKLKQKQIQDKEEILNEKVEHIVDNERISSPPPQSQQLNQSSSQQEFNHNSVSPSIIPIALPSNSSPSKVFIDYIPYSIRKKLKQKQIQDKEEILNEKVEHIVDNERISSPPPQSQQLNQSSSQQEFNQINNHSNSPFSSSISQMNEQSLQPKCSPSNISHLLSHQTLSDLKIQSDEKLKDYQEIGQGNIQQIGKEENDEQQDIDDIKEENKDILNEKENKLKEFIAQQLENIAPINRSIELKECVNQINMRTGQYSEKFYREKLLNAWTQCYVSGVPHIIYGFSDKNGILRKVQHFDVEQIPEICKDYWNKEIIMNILESVLNEIINLVRKQVLEQRKKIRKYIEQKQLVDIEPIRFSIEINTDGDKIWINEQEQYHEIEINVPIQLEFDELSRLI